MYVCMYTRTISSDTLVHLFPLPEGIVSHVHICVYMDYAIIYVTEPVCNDIYTVYVAAGQTELYYTAFEQ